MNPKISMPSPFQIWLSLLGILTLTFCAIIKHYYPGYKDAVWPGEEIGVASLVSAFVSYVYDVHYHEENFAGPVKSIRTTLNELHSELQFLALTVADFNNVLKFSLREDIVAMYKRNDREFQEAVIQAVERAEKFVYVQGRNLEDMIVAPARPGWLHAIVEHKLNDAESKTRFFFLLANVFDLVTGFRVESAYRESTKQGDGLIQQGRDATKRILDFAKSINEKNKLAFRMTTGVPQHLLVMTEHIAFIEHYLPFQRGGSSLILVIRPRIDETDTSLYENYKYNFEVLFSNDPGKQLQEDYPDKDIEDYYLQTCYANRLDNILRDYLARQNDARKRETRKRKWEPLIPVATAMEDAYEQGEGFQIRARVQKSGIALDTEQKAYSAPERGESGQPNRTSATDVKRQQMGKGLPDSPNDF